MTNIVLIGMPGSGKSTCGVLLAKATLKNFFDTDLLLQNLEGKRLQQILNTEGLSYFEKAEERAILSLNIEGTVIATGGSVVYSDRAMRHLQKLGTVVYMHIGFETMEGRIKDLKTRGLAIAEGQTLLNMYNERAPLYEKWAEKTVYCDGLTIDDTVEKIIEVLGLSV